MAQQSNSNSLALTCSTCTSRCDMIRSHINSAYGNERVLTTAVVDKKAVFAASNPSISQAISSPYFPSASLCSFSSLLFIPPTSDLQPQPPHHNRKHGELFPSPVAVWAIKRLVLPVCTARLWLGTALGCCCCCCYCPASHWFQQHHPSFCSWTTRHIHLTPAVLVC